MSRDEASSDCGKAWNDERASESVKRLMGMQARKITCLSPFRYCIHSHLVKISLKLTIGVCCSFQKIK